MSSTPNAIDAMARRILEAVPVHADSSEAILPTLRRLLAEFSMQQVLGFQRVIEANAYYECERIARGLGASDVAQKIHEAGKLDEIHVTACKMEDFR